MAWTDLGDVASVTYPQIAVIGAVRTVCSSYANGWLTGITDAGAGGCPGTTTLATLSYYPNHMVSQVAHGNGVTDSYDKDPNDIGRPARIATANVLSGGNWVSGTYQYDGAGSIKAMRGMTEPIGRPAATGQLYGYDAFGNLTTITQDGSGQTIQTDTTTNRLSSSGYDDTGNVTAWGVYAYTYDGFNAMTTLTGNGLANAYAYDAGGERLSAKAGAAGPTTYSLRGLDGKVLRDYTLTGTTWSWSKDYAYRAGQLLATIDGGGTKHMSLDHLGSPRLITDGSRNVVEYHAYWAYGGEIGTDCGAERMKFTGHERDNQCSAGMLDYMHARYYSPIVGRFLSNDPVGDESGSPQTWNLYAYALGNPLLRHDPTGMSSLVFDGTAHTIQILDNQGNSVGIWPAYNRVQSTNLNGRWEDGTYRMVDTSAPRMHPRHPEYDTPNGKFGTYGDFQAEAFTESNGHRRTLMAVHSGHADVGPTSPTDGCVRSTDQMMGTLVELVKNDPLTTMKVQNNKAPVAPPTPPLQATPMPSQSSEGTAHFHFHTDVERELVPPW